MSIPYTWSVESVNLAQNTFTAQYKNSEDNRVLRINLPLPKTLGEIPMIVKRYEPENAWVKVSEPVSSTLPEADIMALNGSGEIDPADLVAAAALAYESYKKQLAKALFDLGVTSTNVYPESTPASSSTSSSGTEPAVIG
jgi:hypothetical protein